MVTVFLSVRPGASSSTSHRLHPGELQLRLRQTPTSDLAAGTASASRSPPCVVSVAVAAPAGYVLSRGRSRAVSGYSLLLFVIQSLPIITAVIPLFILFARLGLVDNLIGLVIIYVGSSMSVATWMMAAYFDSIPITLEEAAWIDGCSVFGSFTKVVLRNSLPGHPLHRDLRLPGRLERLPRRHGLPASSNIFTLPIGLQSLLPAERHRLGSGDGGRPSSCCSRRPSSSPS